MVILLVSLYSELSIQARELEMGENLTYVDPKARGFNATKIAIILTRYYHHGNFHTFTESSFF